MKLSKRQLRRLIMEEVSPIAVARKENPDLGAKVFPIIDDENYRSFQTALKNLTNMVEKQNALSASTNFPNTQEFVDHISNVLINLEMAVGPFENDSTIYDIETALSKLAESAQSALDTYRAIVKDHYGVESF